MASPRKCPFLTVCVLIGLSAGAPEAESQQVYSVMTPETIDEAIRLASDDKAATRFLDRYVVQTRAGWGNGPLIGSFSTPYARVVQAAVAARRSGNSLGTSDIAEDLLAPELHVVATSQQARSDDSTIAKVLSVVLAARGSKNPADVIQPLRMVELTTDYQGLYGTAFDRPGILAIFPLSALTPASEIRVVFDRLARGSTNLSMCRECVVPVNLSNVR